MENITNWFTYVNDNFEYILEETINHARIVLIVIALATVTSVLLGVLIQRRPVARAVVLTATVLLVVGVAARRVLRRGRGAEASRPGDPVGVAAP